MRKRLIILSVLLVLAIPLCACDVGLEIVGMQIQTYPNRIVYIAGADNALDLSGGTVKYIMRDRSADSSAVPMDDEFITETNNIDFSKPGIYVVTLTRHKGTCQFPVQVIGSDFKLTEN